MATVTDVLKKYSPTFAALTELVISDQYPGLFELRIADDEKLGALLIACVRELEGVDRYDDDPYYKQMCDLAGLTRDELFRAKSSLDLENLAQIELGDLGELIGCLILCAHFDKDPNVLFPRNLAKPSIAKSESGFDIAMIELEHDQLTDQGLCQGDLFTAVESKASRDARPAALSNDATKNFEQTVAEVHKILEMYVNHAHDRFAGSPAVKRIPFFLMERYQKSERFAFCIVATTSTAPPADLATIHNHIITLGHATCIVCTVATGDLVQTVFSFRREAS